MNYLNRRNRNIVVCLLRFGALRRPLGRGRNYYFLLFSTSGGAGQQQTHHNIEMSMLLCGLLLFFKGCTPH